MEKPFTNVHTHIFNTDCAPDRFLRVLSLGALNIIAEPVKGLLESRVGMQIVGMLYTAFRSRDSQKALARYVSFLQIGSKGSQLEIFQHALQVGRHYDPAIRIVGLTMNMDFMDSQFSIRRPFDTQLEEVKNIKRYYPDHFFPFLGVDPRHAVRDLGEWVEKQLTAGFQHKGKVYPYFCGIKIYPAQGFFPFDPRLEPVYAFAESHDIPVMTHCTRSGSMYIGDYVQELIPLKPPVLHAQKNPSTKDAQKRIYDRIQKYYDAELVKNNRYGDNDAATDLFSHPENYIPVLEAFPKLKLCLAHMGGTTEFVDTVNPAIQKRRQLEGGRKWLDHIQEMMSTYPYLYTDISYTLSDFKNSDILTIAENFLGNPQEPNALGHRVLFGTDFFMTEQESKESDLYSLFMNNERLASWRDALTRENPARYLSNVR